MAKIKDGDKVALIHRPGEVIKGTVRRFEVPDNIYEIDRKTQTRGKLLRTEVIERWEIVTRDSTQPAIGFDPETAEFEDVN